MSQPGNYWAPLCATAQAVSILRRILGRPKTGKGKVFSDWKKAKRSDKTWYPSTYWCYSCDAGGKGAGTTVHGPVCELCHSPVEDLYDCRREYFENPSDAPKGSEFWTHDMWCRYEDALEAYYDSITPDCE